MSIDLFKNYRFPSQFEQLMTHLAIHNKPETLRKTLKEIFISYQTSIRLCKILGLSKAHTKQHLRNLDLTLEISYATVLKKYNHKLYLELVLTQS